MAKAAAGRGGERVPLEIEVRNFGPISRGKFRIKPLTVFVGPNNSGKTFAAMLAHAVISSRGGYEHPLDYVEWIRGMLKDPKFMALVTQMEEVVTSARSSGTSIPSKYVNRVKNLVLGRYFASNLPETIMEVFGAGLKDLVRIGNKISTIKIKYHINANMSIQATDQTSVSLDFADISYTIRNQQGEITIYETNKQIFGQNIDLGMLDDAVKREMGKVARTLGIQKKSGLYYLLYLMKRIDLSYGYLPTSCYLPAGRSGFMAAQIPIVTSMMTNKRFLGTAPRRINPTSGVVFEYMNSLVRLDEYSPYSKDKNGQEMFVDMFGGKLEVVKPKSGLPRITYKIGKRAIPLNLLSSGITETASLQLFQQNMSELSDVLVLEEPEAHLHPENQSKLAKHIVRLVNSGVHVLLITHSVFFLEQISIFVRMSKVPAEKRKKLGYDEEDFLEDKDIAPYIFKRDNSRGYTIQNMEHAPEDGISQEEFDQIIDVMGNKELQIDHILDDT